MSVGSVGNDPASRNLAAQQLQRAQLENNRDRTGATNTPGGEPSAEPAATKNPVEAAVQEAVRAVQQGIESILKQAVPPVPGEGEGGAGGDPELGPQAGRKIRCGRGGRCVADASPRLGLQNNVG
ncbi:MAG: hypothetical protein IT382_06445 [Deltaproteobacteria bacterium]|nr:hypothetical protein [Deltaproteobacteria bacterium]